MWVPLNSGKRSGSCSENCGFRIAQVVRCHSKNGILHSENYFLNSENCSENTPELSQSFENSLFTSRVFFLRLGWSPAFWYLRIGNGVGKQGYGNRPPIDGWNPIRKFSIDPLCLQNQWDNSASTDSPRQRIKEKSR